jgi:hypothetical protein
MGLGRSIAVVVVLSKESNMYVDSQGTLERPPVYNVRRREPRYVCSLHVTMQRFLRLGPVVAHGVLLDISTRGMSALICGAPLEGETVAIELPLPGCPIETLATVRHSSDAKSGFEFYPLTANAKKGIQDWIQELRKHEEKLFPYRFEGTVHPGSG